MFFLFYVSLFSCLELNVHASWIRQRQRQRPDWTTDDTGSSYLECREPLPPDTWSGWWSTRGPSEYKNVIGLCDYLAPPRQRSGSMGCACPDVSSSTPPFCNRDWSDRSLFDLDSLRSLCLNRCRCSAGRWAAPLNAEALMNPDPMTIRDRKFDRTQTYGSKQTPLLSSTNFEQSEQPEHIEHTHMFEESPGRACPVKENGFCKITISKVNTDHSFASLEAPKPVEHEQSTCQGLCKNFRCSGPAENCRCLATKIPNRNVFTGNCGSLPKRKRCEQEHTNTQVACPCNGTYVSAGCCYVDNGIVHEDTSQNLGTMLPEDDPTYDPFSHISPSTESELSSPSHIPSPSSHLDQSQRVLGGSEVPTIPNRAICVGTVPTQDPPIWPWGHSYKNYTSLSELCNYSPYTETQPPHLGGFCGSPNPALTPYKNYLYNANPVLFLTPELLAYCAAHCGCESDLPRLLGLPTTQPEISTLNISHTPLAEPEDIVSSSDEEEARGLRKRSSDAKGGGTTGCGLSGDNMCTQSHTEQSILSIVCLIVGVLLSIVGSALSWQDKGLRGRRGERGRAGGGGMEWAS